MHRPPSSRDLVAAPSVRVVQAFFVERPVPGGLGARAFVRIPPPPHAATAVAQARPAASPAARAPHPATVVQPRGAPGSGVAARAPHPATVVQPRVPFGAAARVPASKPAAGGGSAQRKEADAHAFQPPPGFLEGPAKPGEPLPSPVKLRMERYFGVDFSDVRVHTGPEAGSIGALAFTLGSDIYFAPGHYQPQSHYGQELLGHELTHVVQQRDGRVANPFGEGVAVVQDFDLEAEADRCGKEAAEGKWGAGPPPTAGAGGSGAQGGSGVQTKSGYQLVVGTYLHGGRLPEPLAGHSFVAIQEPTGQRRAFGFSPAHYGTYDPNKELGRLRAGVEGVVHDDATAFEKPGVKTHAYPISPAQAQAAMAKVQEYQSGKYRFSLDGRQCSTFALDVMRAARLPVPEDGPAPPPRVMYQALDDDS